ncbi:hypothetical protein HYR69_00400 [Candidatus Sumerlaeota bacterium]|nr:hypothetical protein [Candidatus Sumerlaeota bacterium]
MIMADVLKVFLVILGLIIVMISYWLAGYALFPNLVERSRGEYTGHPIRTAIIGTVVFVPCMIVAIALLNNPWPPTKIAGGAVLFAAILGGMIGSAGLAQHVGLRMPSPIDESQPWRRVLRGGIVLTLTYVLPFLGWFLMSFTIVSGFGALIMTLSAGRKRAVPAEPSVAGEAAAA